MNPADFHLGFMVRGSHRGRRTLIDADAALRGYAACDAEAEAGRESYLSAFRFDDSFRTYLESHGGSEAGFAGPVWGDWLHFDIDRADPDAALADTRKLVCRTLDRYSSLDEDAPLAFFSGKKGFHVSLPVSLFGTPAPSLTFNATARAVAERVAQNAGVELDLTVYSRTRLFRAPNSRHPSGSYKRHLPHSALMGMSADRIRQIAAEPMPFDIPAQPLCDKQAVADWAEAEKTTREQQQHGRSRATAAGPRSLQRDTIDLIHGTDIPEGTRDTRLFRAAANLAELGTPDVVIREILDAPGRNCGLSSSELAKCLTSGIDNGKRKRGNG